jgi:hypothetical protein
LDCDRRGIFQLAATSPDGRLFGMWRTDATSEGIQIRSEAAFLNPELREFLEGTLLAGVL